MCDYDFITDIVYNFNTSLYVIVYLAFNLRHSFMHTHITNILVFKTLLGVFNY